jgi:hypothetical protein
MSNLAKDFNPPTYTAYGGAICNQGGGQLLVNNSNFTMNRAGLVSEKH